MRILFLLFYLLGLGPAQPAEPDCFVVCICDEADGICRWEGTCPTREDVCSPEGRR